MKFCRIMTDGAESSYVDLETVLGKINQKFIALPEDEVRRNNHVLKVVNKIISKMKTKDALFRNLYTTLYYGGSYYDGLKVGRPSEYDLDCLLALPKFLKPTVLPSDRPGFVHISLENLDNFRKKKDEFPKYQGFEKLLVGKRLSTTKVLAWMESVVSAALNDLTTGDKSSKVCKMRLRIQDELFMIKATVTKAGPALTLNVAGWHQGQKYELDVDLVTCFTFRQSQWPVGYRSNPSINKVTFFVVPKSPKGHPDYWRLSFQEQEKQLLSNCKILKPTLRLLKKLRDRNQHNVIASYFLKTIFLWELDQCSDLHNGQLSIAFIKMLAKYEEYVRKNSIPYYWNEGHNLLGDLKVTTTQCIANEVGNMLKKIKGNSCKDPFTIAKYLLSDEEILELKEELVYLGTGSIELPKSKM